MKAMPIEEMVQSGWYSISFEDGHPLGSPFYFGGPPQLGGDDYYLVVTRRFVAFIDPQRPNFLWMYWTDDD